MRISAVMAGVLVLAVVSGSLVAYAKYRSVYDSIGRVDVSSDLNGIKQPPVDPNAINILLIGSDSRSGANGKIGGTDGIDGQRSDTVMVLHIAPAGHSAVVLSFPRDSVVPVLGCTAENGSPGQTANSGEVEQINATFADGGPGCLWETVEETTNIHIDNFVELTFEGFEKVINDLGGVNVCLPAAVDDAKSGLNLSAGPHHVFGPEALAFWRTREDVGEGSDLQRIQRDQFLMASLLQGIEHSGLLGSPSKISSVISDVARNMTTDKGLNQSRMLSIAEGLRHLTSQNVQFVEVPTQTYEPNPAWVQWTSQASQLFSQVAHDTTIPKAAAKKKPVATAPAITPSQVSVEVLNGSGLQGVAAEGSADLTSRGFNVVGSHNALNFNYTKSVVEYASAADRPAAALVEQQFSDAEILQEPGLAPGTVDVILGSDFTSLATTPTAGSGSGSTAGLTQTFGGITGNTSICSDGSAFSGPDGN
ncbi:MAG TPA: LCP family protein [Streptosporangiaceae bacterium]|jgi:LCP family protein required for cell wall assembly|nr:LCP family protein [Streptosporangiaceae bacterium]